jgi:putative glutamine amidotransferase
VAAPLIAVSAAIERRPTAFGEIDCTLVAAAYSNAIYAAGAQPVVMPVTDNPPGDLLARMDGLVLTGGADIDPALYGEEPDETVYGVRRDRDIFESALFVEAITLGLPVLAICRGMQLVNIIRGGTLFQQLISDLDHWQLGAPDEPCHAVEIADDSMLAETFGSVALVNSYHHQALNVLGEQLRVVATCGGVIEAVEGADCDLLGVQWHPEHMASTDDAQRAIFNAFVRRVESNRRGTVYAEQNS